MNIWRNSAGDLSVVVNCIRDSRGKLQVKGCGGGDSSGFFTSTSETVMSALPR